MLSGSAILRISLLLVVAGCLAALVQYFLPHGAAPVDERPVATPPAATAPPPRQVGPPVPVPSTAPRRDTAVARPPAPAPMPAPATMPTPAPQPTAEAPAVQQTPPEPRTVSPELDASQPAGRAEVDAAADTAGPRALALVDLNTASVADLNGLRGGGSIGRAIIQRRPYASVDQLLSKRVLSRATYDKIKDQVTVR
ncbi:hypothetical protein AFCDBAGC_4099 [Methylobacterium cerastii]|uniref:Helix-hairpin-helix domain-containing protein n=1 Tax=Methylobacterium cerastii TaxID=932741 RepID=A0ABQ4QNC1_9HYPH|nr:helix-hairpin-helix domain-containing protein [Methylobacterium cerastii]GJD46219.1 hypothetical protein AFCDBAGC_4099 [Methylobacterium cerastii]